MVHKTCEEDVLNSRVSPAKNFATEAEVHESVVMDVAPIQAVPPADLQVEEASDGGNSMNSSDCRDVNEEIDVAEEGEGEDSMYLSDEDEDEDEDGEGDEDDVDVDADEEDDDGDDVDEGEDDFMEEDDDVDEDEVGDLENGVDDIDGDKKDEGTTGGEDGKENAEKEGVSLEPKVEKLVKKNNNDSDKVTEVNKGKAESEEKNNPKKGEKENGKEEVGEKGEGSSRGNVKRLRQRGKKKLISGSSVKAASESNDKLNSKLKKKVRSKRAESMGMVFMCSSQTKKDCYRYKILGLPASKRDLVEKIYRGMRLFLYDVDLKLMYGIYKAAARGGYNIERKAFNSKFPAQVRFTVLEDCIPLAEEKFRKVLKENYFTKNKFDCQLTHEQVKNLCKLFIAASKGSKRLDRVRKARAPAFGHRDRSRAQGVVPGRRGDRSGAAAIDEGRRRERSRDEGSRQDRSRAQGIDEGRRRDRSRAQGIDEERRIVLDEGYLHRDYFHVRPRELATSPVARAPLVASLHSPTGATPRYAYERTFERDAYRQNVLLEHRDPYRPPPLVPRDTYRQLPLSDYRAAYRQEPPPLDRYDTYRRDRAPEHRDLRPLDLELRRRDDIAAHDPYSYYMDPQPYRDPVYIEHRPPAEPDRYRPLLRTEYRPRGCPVSDHRSARALYRY